MNKNGHQPHNNAEEKFMMSVPKILYGILKEKQRANALAALRLKFDVDENYAITSEDVDRIMNSDPAGKYTKDEPND